MMMAKRGTPWTNEEMKMLLEGIEKGKSWTELAQAHGRSTTALALRLLQKLPFPSSDLSEQLVYLQKRFPQCPLSFWQEWSTLCSSCKTTPTTSTTPFSSCGFSQEKEWKALQDTIQEIQHDVRQIKKFCSWMYSRQATQEGRKKKDKDMGRVSREGCKPRNI